MKKTAFIIVSSVLGILSLVGCKHDPIEPLVPTTEICFQDKILPVIQSNCAKSGCHDAITQEEDLTLTNYNNIMKIVRAGKPSESELYEVLIKSPGSEKFMPPSPNAPLTTEQLALIYGWIAQGAKNTTCASSCDTNVFTFSGAVQPIIQQYCIGCHGTNPSGNTLSMTNYGQILIAVNSKNLYNRITSISDPMPPSGQLEACKIRQIKKWIDAGKLNN